jgi:hypothetical protein
VVKLPLSVDFQQKVGELVLSTTSCPSVAVLENRKKCGYGNFDHWYNVSPIHLLALLGVGEF